MNHTIKGIIIVAAITSMLVVGLSIVPIMQISFADKKSDFKKAERDTTTNTNINTNTNSADSSSTSDATASNTNNIDNTACAVAVTCHEGSKTVRQTPTPTPGTLEIFKDCNNTCPGIAFSIHVTGNNPQPRSVSLSDEQSEIVTLGPGTFTVTESPVAGFFPPIFGGACKQTAPNSNMATGTISAGQDLVCVIKNTKQP